MNFAELIAAVNDNPRSVVIPAHWGQGRASFGGLVAALQYLAMRAQVADNRPVRSLAITFVGPVAPEVAVSFEVEILREGSAVTQVLGHATQNGQTCALVQGSFGAPRESVARYEPPVPVSELKPLADSFTLPFVKGAMPDFLQHMDVKWALGGLPFSNSPSPVIGGYVRLRDAEQQALSEAHVLALVDAWPSGLLTWVNKPTPASSLTWTIEFVHPQPALTTHDWCSYRAEIEHARDGYGHCAATLRAPDGALIAISRQTVTVFG